MNPVYRTIESLDWISILFFSSLLIMTMGKYFFKNVFYNFIILPFNNKYVTLYNKKGKLFNWFHILLTLFQLLNISLFAFLSRKILLNEDRTSPMVFLIITGIVLGVLSFKILLQLANGFVFDMYKTVTSLIFNKISYFNHSSIVAFFANIILVYVLKDSKPTVYLAIFAILSINVIGLYNALKNHQKQIASNFVYFILYLCTLEIAPLVIIGSYLKA